MSLALLRRMSIFHLSSGWWPHWFEVLATHNALYGRKCSGNDPETESESGVPENLGSKTNT